MNSQCYEKVCAFFKPSGVSNHYVITAKLSSSQTLLHTATDSLHTLCTAIAHTHQWPASDLGCSKHGTSRAILGTREAPQDCVQADATLKYHRTSATAPLLKPTSINIFFSRLICSGLDSSHPHPFCANTQNPVLPRTQLARHSPSGCTSISRGSQPPHACTEIQRLDNSYFFKLKNPRQATRFGDHPFYCKF